MSLKKTVGLVLGCGSSRGWAHIGAIEALEEENIPIDFIVGCSVGAYVGAIYAGGSIQSLKEFVLKMDGKKVFSYFDIVLPRSGILDGTKRLKELFSIHTDVQNFSELNIPVMMVATSIAIMQDRINRINLAVTPPDVLIRPHLGELKMLDFDQVEHVIEEGYTKAKEKIGDIRAMIEMA